LFLCFSTHTQRMPARQYDASCCTSTVSLCILCSTQKCLDFHSPPSQEEPQ
jgi:hypothetical protein